MEIITCDPSLYTLNCISNFMQTLIGQQRVKDLSHFICLLSKHSLHSIMPC